MRSCWVDKILIQDWAEIHSVLLLCQGDNSMSNFCNVHFKEWLNKAEVSLINKMIQAWKSIGGWAMQCWISHATKQFCAIKEGGSFVLLMSAFNDTSIKWFTQWRAHPFPSILLCTLLLNPLTTFVHHLPQPFSIPFQQSDYKEWMVFQDTMVHCKAIPGWGPSGLMRWISVWTMPQVQDKSLY